VACRFVPVVTGKHRLGVIVQIEYVLIGHIVKTVQAFIVVEIADARRDQLFLRKDAYDIRDFPC